MCFFAVVEANDWDIWEEDIWVEDIWDDDIWVEDIWEDDIWEDDMTVLELTTDDVDEPSATIPLWAQDVVGETTRVSDFVVLVLFNQTLKLLIIIK
jgi:hypothetical protein